MKFTSEPIAEHAEVPLADEGRWEDIIAHWTHREAPARQRHEDGNACYVVSVQERRSPHSEAQLAEMLGLVRGQGDRIVGQEIVTHKAPTPKTYIGQGMARDIAARANNAGADLLVLDAELSPSQMRNLEDTAGIRVSDREAVILNVFQRSARTRAARMQVEIAHLEYLRPRIRGLGLNMDQQAGGIMGSRGPGETASELMARRLDGRLVELRNALARFQRAGQMQRKHRAATKRIALVGYTNAGKTSLMNALTDADLSARDQPFETLDTTSRSLTRHGGDVLISDTVGFIRRLPVRLLASFESTLAEVLEASLLALVVDVSDPEWEVHLSTSEQLLDRLGAQELRRFYIFNKTDRVPGLLNHANLASVTRGYAHLALSAWDVNAVSDLKRALIAAARFQHQEIRLFVPYSAMRATAVIYSKCRVIDSDASDTGLQLTVEGEPHILQQIQRLIKGDTQ